MPIAKSGQILSTLEDWKKYAPPKSPGHWVDGRSAKELARAWLADKGTSMPPEVLDALLTHPSFGTVQSWQAEPEAKLRFDEFPGEPRNSDLAIHVHDEAGEYLLAIEGKADEPYGETVMQAFAAALERRIEKPGSNGVARIEQLAASLLLPRTGTLSSAVDLRYQLLTACAGAVAEAHRRNAARAVILIHEFITPQTKDGNHARNAADLAAFLSRLMGRDLTVADDGRLYGPFESAYAPGVRMFIGKVSRNIREQPAP